MNNSVLQIPISKELRRKSEKAAIDAGFSSLQDLVRLFLHKFSRQELTVNFDLPEDKLSPAAARRYAKMVADYDKDPSQYRSFNNVDDMMKYLHDDHYNSHPQVQKVVHQKNQK